MSFLVLTPKQIAKIVKAAAAVEKNLELIVSLTAAGAPSVAPEDAPAKKRGRKPKVVSETAQAEAPAKKRGRKPKAADAAALAN